MKKITLILSAAAFACTVGLTSCAKKAATVETPGCTNPNAFNYNKDAKKDDGTCQLPQTTKKAAIYDITGLWCPPCGEYGLPTFDKVSTDNKLTAVPFSLHSNDLFSSPAATLLINGIFKESSVPRMAVGTDWVFKAGVTTDINYNAQKMTAAINNIVLNDLVVGTNITKSISGGTLTVTTNSKFASAQSGTDYYLAVFVLENGLIGEQETVNKGKLSMTHNHVLRHCFNTSITGDLLASGTIEANKVITKTFTKVLPVLWNPANLSIATVIYYRDGSGIMKFENANILE